MNDEPIVYIVDDDPLVLSSLRAVLESHQFEVLGSRSGEELLRRLQLDRPGCVVTDLQMPSMNGLELQKRLLAVHSELAIIVVSGVADVSTAVRIMENGAVTLLEKPYRASDLIEAVRRGCRQSAGLRAARLRYAGIEARLGTLSAEEREVMDQMLTGKSNKAISHQLHLSSRTLDRRRRAIFDKMQIPTIVELAIAIHRPPPPS